MKIQSRFGLFAVLAALALLVVLLSFTGAADRADRALADALYQRLGVSAGQIVLIEIDEESLRALGADPQAWGRGEWAALLRRLSRGEDCRPAVVGLDAIFAYETDPAQDAALAGAAAEHGGVVTGSLIYYGTRLETAPDGSYTLQTGAALDGAGPYAALGAVSAQGVVNAAADTDGVVRHARWRFRDEAGLGRPSFALAVAEAYARETGAAFTPPARSESYLAFTCGSGGYREGISFSEVLAGKYPPEIFDGKIVLVGACAPALQDAWLTAASRTEAMYGVEVHANAVEQLLWGEEKTEIADGVQRLALLAALLLCALAFAALGLPGMLLVWAAACGGGLALCRALYGAGRVAHPLWLPAGATLLLAAGIAGRFLREAAARRALRERFGKYVDPQILRQIADGADTVELSGEERSIAVLFVDLCGFTALSEKLPPRRVVEILNRYLDMVTGCILRSGGTLDKFIGDCAMAFWNAPLTQDDPAGRAVQAGFDMLAEGERLRRELGLPLSFAIGVHCGEAVVGNIGSSKRMDFTAIGDTVNTASRLESLKLEGRERGGALYASAAVAEALAGRVRAEDLGVQTLRGREEPLRVYALTPLGDE